MKLPIGYDNFRKIIDHKLDFVDKSLFIKEVIDDTTAEVILITRPRRFGKTLNLSMLQYFLAAKVNGQSTAGLFNHLKISQVDEGAYMQHQGKYPVISISFKDIKSEHYDLAYEKLYELIIRAFGEHDYLEQSEKIGKTNKDLFKIILDRKANRVQIENSLQILCACLLEHHGTKPWLLIDEYDTPIQASYLHGYYNKMIELMRGMFGAALKTNQNLGRAVITGILRVAKESLFSGLNNLRVYSILHEKYSQYFGFTEEEMNELLQVSGLVAQSEDIKKWYNGYQFGQTIIYNPWSIANCIDENGTLRPYWVNTSDNNLVRSLVTKSSAEFKAQFELLLQDKTVSKIIDENVIFGDLDNNHQAAWSLLIMSGYLKVVSSILTERGNTLCECAIPNWEVKALYLNIIEAWLGNGHGMEWYQSFLTDLLNGDITKFTENFGQVLAQTISVHDMAHNPEAFYHGFMLGLAAGLDRRRYEVKSNRESGLGRYDIVIIPKDVTKPAIILEIKSVVPPKVSKRKLPDVLEVVLKQEAEKALEQINHNRYISELTQRGLNHIVKIGLAFSGKEFRVKSESSQ